MKTLFVLLLIYGACRGFPRYSQYEVCPYPYECVPEGQCYGITLDTSSSKDWWQMINQRTSQSTCGHSKIHGVCCDNSHNYQVASQCGVRNGEPAILDIDNRIRKIASNEVQFGEFPWQAGIFSSNSGFLCGAVLIGHKWVVTVAHHVEGHKPVDLKVRLGEWQFSSSEEPLSHLDVDVAAINIHPEFNPSNKHNDIAILELTEAVSFQYHINSICLPNPGQTFLGQQCFVTGWGEDTYGGPIQHIMKKVDLPIVEDKQCQKFLRRTSLGEYFIVDDSFICAGGEENKDACKGYGGGPLACQDPDTGRYVLAGVSATGVGCGLKDVPGLYADVQALLPFVQNVLNRYNETKYIFDLYRSNK